MTSARNPSHALVVGGTGMLAGVTRALAARASAVSVIARTEASLDALVESVASDRSHETSDDASDDTSNGASDETFDDASNDASSKPTGAASARIHPLQLDYHDLDALDAAVESAIAAHGPIDLSVWWIHGTAKLATDVLGRRLARQDVHCRIVHVLGSAAGDPSTDIARKIGRFGRDTRLDYRLAVLGFVVEDGESRWLTDAEICEGVLAAIDDADPNTRVHVVGTVTPWAKRPC